MNLIYDRTAEDVERSLALAKKAEAGTLTDTEKTEWLAGMKGCYNAADMNRVEAAVNQLASALTSAGYPAAVTPVLKGASVLPSGYTELEYIQSSGTQYIDTGVVPSTALITEITFACESNGIAENAIFGSAWSVSGYFFMVYGEINGFRWHSCGGYADAVVSDVTAKHNAICQKGKLTLDGVEYTLSASGSDSTNAVRLFGVTSNEGYTRAANGIYKLYRCKMHNGNTVYRDFIPCKNPSGTVGLYDLVGGEFYTTPTAAGAVALPEGYTQVEYLQSSGTQYIDTGFKPDGETTVNIVFQTSSAPDNLSDTLPVYGAATDYNSNAFEFWTLSGGFATYGSQDYKSNLGITTGKKHTVSQAKNVLTVDGTSYTFTKQTFTAPYSLLLFATHRSGGIKICASAANLKIYSCKIYNNGTLVRDFVPAKNSSGTIGLYDTVNGTFYTNAGSGTFTAGADIAGFTAGADVSSYEDREWRETDTVRLSQWRQYLANVQALRDAYYTLAETGQLSDAEDKLDYVGANNIEKILADIDLLIGWMKSSYRRCGTFQAGNNAAHLPLKGSA